MFKNLFRKAKKTKDNGHETVDMGLPSGNLWATENVGSDFVRYFSWGDTTTKNSYELDNYKKDLGSKLTAKNDAVRAWWGGGWETPSIHDYIELLQNSKMKWSSEKGGIVLTSKVNGNTLFFPATGKAILNEIVCKGTDGLYWTCDTPTYPKYNADQCDRCAIALTFNFEKCSLGLSSRGFGIAVRGVLKKE